MQFRDKPRLIKLQISKILPNPSQPRKVFNEDELEGLSKSIRENGLLQPVTVRHAGGAYYLVAGERRLKACKMAGLGTVPAILCNCDAQESAVLALTENLQRRDLNIFEQANAIVNLLREQQITQEEAARRLSMSQSALANKLRLLKLGPEEQSEILAAGLTERHARALLRIDDVSLRRKALDAIIDRGLNVAQTEEAIAELLKRSESLSDRPAAPKKRRRTFVAKDVRLFINTIDRAVDAMKTAGIAAEARRCETPEYIECTVRIPKAGGARRI